MAEQGRPAKLSGRQTAWQFIKFTLFSISAGLIQAGAFALLNELTGLPYWPSYLIALVLSVVWNLTFNRRFTFRSSVNMSKASQMARTTCNFSQVLWARPAGSASIMPSMASSR